MASDGENISQTQGKATFEINFRSGHVIGQNQNGSGEVIVQKIYNIIAQPKSKILEQITQELAAGNHFASYLLLEKAYDTGEFFFKQEEALLEKIGEIETTDLSDEQIFKLFKIKFYIAGRLGSYARVEEDAKYFLKRYSRSLDKDLYDVVTLVRANGAAQKGKKELAQNLYNKLLEHKESINISTYAWACRGVAITLSSSHPEFYKYHEMAADAFLQCGQRIEAAKSLYNMADFIEGNNLEDAFNLIKDADSLLNPSSLNSRFMIAASHHRRARILSKLQNYEIAVSEIKSAIELYSNLIGCEDELFSSLSLASEIYQGLNQQGEVENLKRKKEELKPFLRDKIYQLQVVFAELIASDNIQAVKDLLRELENQEHKYLQIMFHVFNATNNPKLNNEDKLETLDHAISILKNDNFSNELWSVVCFSLASTYLEQNLDRKAIEWYQKTLNYDSFNFIAIQNLAALLQRNGMWKELSCFFAKQREQFGDNAIVLYWYGRALLELGDADKAAPILAKSFELAKECELVDSHHIEELRNKALASATELNHELVKPSLKPRYAVNRKKFEVCLNAFTKFVQSDKRMTFWSFDKGDKSHKWIKKPEQYAQNLLHTFIKAYFEDQVDVFEEVNTGAGRIDVFLKFSNNLSTVVELKMCGFGYSMSYAEGGLDQLSHYLSNKYTSLGYLIVFDARTRDFGKGFSEILTIGKHTIFTRTVDVRPIVKYTN
jgi:tetratricopeptide (TPR) repeat protein